MFEWVILETLKVARTVDTIVSTLGLLLLEYLLELAPR